MDNLGNGADGTIGGNRLLDGLSDQLLNYFLRIKDNLEKNNEKIDLVVNNSKLGYELFSKIFFQIKKILGKTSIIAGKKHQK